MGLSIPGGLHGGSGLHGGTGLSEGSGLNLDAGATIALSALSIAEDAEVNDVIGTLSVNNGSGSYTFSIPEGGDPDGKFQIANDDELQVADTLDFETATSHQVTISADNGVDPPIERTFTITVTDVLEAPANIVAPVISGNVQVGQELATTDGTWTGSPSSYTYQWQRDGEDISGATANTYTLIEEDAGVSGPITCEVTATNGAGSSDPEASNALAIDVYLVFLTSIEDPASVSLYNTGDWEDVNFGPAAANRKLVLSVGGTRVTSPDPAISAVTIGGESGVEILSVPDPGSPLQTCAIYAVDLGLGASGDISIQWDDTISRCGAGLYALYGAGDIAQRTYSNGNAVNTKMLVPAGGVGVGYSILNGNGAAWTTLSEDFEASVETVIFHSGASLNPSAETLADAKVEWASTSQTSLPAVYAVWQGLTAPSEYLMGLDLARTWFNAPSTIEIGGALWIGGINNTGPAAVAGSVVVSREGILPIVLHSALHTDDHCNPALLRRSSDGKIMVLYSQHNNGGDYYQRISTNADDMTSWETEDTLKSQIASGATNFSYGQLIEITDGIFNFLRIDNLFSYTLTVDGGATWAAAVQLLANGEERPYMHACKGGANRIDIACNDGNPEGDTDAGIRHFYYDGGSWHQSDGTEITSPPFTTTSELTTVYDGSTTRAWTWDIQSYGGAPIIVFARFVSTSDHRYMRAKWNGSSWDVHEICTAGGSMSSGAQVYYSGGVCLDPDDEDVIYCSRDTGSGFEIWRGVTSDGGETWSMEQLTSDGVKATRPQKLAGSAFITYIRGTYTSFTNFNTDIHALDVS